MRTYHSFLLMLRLLSALILCLIASLLFLRFLIDHTSTVFSSSFLSFLFFSKVLFSGNPLMRAEPGSSEDLLPGFVNVDTESGRRVQVRGSGIVENSLTVWMSVC